MTATGQTGRRRQAHGGHGEAVADQLHAACALRGVAWVRRVSSHWRPVGGGKVLPVQKSTVDCLGVLSTGRGVAVEVKSCASERFELRYLPPHQRDELAAFARLGGLSLLLILGERHGWAIEWAGVKAAIDLGAKSIPLSPDAPWAFSLVDGRPYLARWTGPSPAPGRVAP